MAVNYTNGHKNYQHFLLQELPKFSPNWDFCFENIASGNPYPETFKRSRRKSYESSLFLLFWEDSISFSSGSDLTKTLLETGFSA
jgi:hypothetical protein